MKLFATATHCSGCDFTFYRCVNPPYCLSLFWSRAEEKQADDLGQSTRYEEETHQNRTAFILPCPYLLGRNQPHISEPARVVNPEMKKEIQRNEEEANGKRNVVSMTSLKAKVVSHSSLLVLLPLFYNKPDNEVM